MIRTRSKRAARGSTLGTLPLMSMIDVVFLLLVYFLVTSSFREPERTLPSTVQTEGGGTRASELQPQIVDIAVSGSGVVEYRIGGRVMTSRGALAEVLGSLPKEPGIAIRARRDVPIRAIAAAMQVARDAGFQRRSYVPRDE